LFTDPLLERLADDRRTDVDYPLFGSLRYVLIVRKEVSDVGNVGDELQDLLDGERLILRHVEVLNLIIQEVSLLLVQDVFDEVDGGVVCSKRAVSDRERLDLP